jgi:hypothetical protein
LPSVVAVRAPRTLRRAKAAAGFRGERREYLNVLALVRLLPAVATISAWGNSEVGYSRSTPSFLAGMAARSSAWSRRICLGNKREWAPVRVSMMKHQANEVMARSTKPPVTRAVRNSCCVPPEATDEEFRALITKWRRERPGWRLKE